MVKRGHFEKIIAKNSILIGGNHTNYLLLLYGARRNEAKHITIVQMFDSMAPFECQLAQKDICPYTFDSDMKTGNNRLIFVWFHFVILF